MTNRQERIVYLLMAVNSALFVLIFTVVAFNYRLAADDFHFLVMAKELGIWESMQFYYANWNPRWAGILLTNLVLVNYTSPISLGIFYCLSLGIGFVAIRSLAASFIQGLGLSFSKLQLTILAIYMLAGLFYSSFSKDDTWFWFVANPVYLCSSFAAILGGSLIVQSWFRPLRIVLVSLLFLYAGGSSETVAIATIISLFYLGFISHGKKFLVSIDKVALHVATISCLIGFGIVLLGPGTNVRYDHLPQYAFSDRLLVGFWNYAKLTLMKIPLVLPACLICVAPIAFLGRKQLRFQIMTLKELVFINRKLWALADIIIIALAFALAFSMGEIGPNRAWIPVTFLVMTISVVFAYQLGTWLYIKLKGKLFLVVVVSQSIAIGYQLYRGTTQFMQTSRYANAVDDRMITVSSLTSNQELIELEPLPDSGWLFSSEITTDTTHFTNSHLRLYFENQHQFMKRDTVPSNR